MRSSACLGFGGRSENLAKILAKGLAPYAFEGITFRCARCPTPQWWTRAFARFTRAFAVARCGRLPRVRSVDVRVVRHRKDAYR